MNSLNLTFNGELLKKKLYPFTSLSRITIKDEFFTPSAVLFSIIPYENQPYNLVLIRRTSRENDKHSGEMSFPGGKFDPKKDKTLEDTALRECEEEIGVSRKEITILGCLHDFPTMSRFIITPFIGIFSKNQKLVKEEREVQEIVKVPIDFFVSKKNFKEQAYEVEGKKFPVFYFNYKESATEKKYTIWGATAFMISTFIELVYDFKMSDLPIKRFGVEEIRSLKNYILYKDQITKALK